MSRVRLAAVKIPEQGVASGTSAGILLVAPYRPHRRIIALDAFVVRKDWFQWREDLQTFVAVPIVAVREKGPKIPSSPKGSHLGIPLRHVRVKKEQNTHTVAIQRIGMNAIVFVDRPEVPGAFEELVGRMTVEWPYATRVRGLTAAKNNERPGRANFFVILSTIVRHSRPEQPRHAGRIPHRRSREAIERNDGLCMFFIGTAKAGALIQKERPQHKFPVVPRDRDSIVPGVGLHGWHFVFMTDNRPELPAGQSVPVP